MRLPARSIWDTRIQSVCGIVCARGDGDVEAFMSGNFAQVTLDPMRVIINPNRLYPIDGVVRQAGRFSVSVMPASAISLLRELAHVRRREPHKVRYLNLPIDEHPNGIPYVKGALRTLFCEVERTLDTGDHRVIVGRVIHQLRHSSPRELPCLYQDLKDTSPRISQLRALLSRMGALDLLRSVLYRLRPPSPPDIARNTYLDGGQTEGEVAQVLSFGPLDIGRTLSPGSAPALVRRQIGLCVVGTGWGLEHVKFAKRADPSTRIFLCGTNEERTSRLAARMGLAGYFVGMERAVQDPRVQALTIALPHDRHESAVELAAAHGKHVLVEKPIATTLDAADRMIERSRTSGIILMVAEDMHFRPAMKAASRLISSGLLGEPVYFLSHVAAHRRPLGWQSDLLRAGGGPWMDHGVHYVRAMRLLMGEPDEILATHGMQIDTRLSTEDSIQVMCRSRQGWHAHLFFSWIANRGVVPDIIVHGEKGALHLFDGAAHIDFFGNAPTLSTRLISYVRPYSLQAKLQRPWQQRQRHDLGRGDLTGYTSEVREFLAAVAEDRAPASPPMDARRDLEIVLTGYTAMARDAWTPVPALVGA
ncbi:MAG: flavin reductase [Vicinamibacterales bacterium]